MATKFNEIFTLLLFYVVPVKSKVKISQNFAAFSEYMNFTFEKEHELLHRQITIYIPFFECKWRKLNYALSFNDL